MQITAIMDWQRGARTGLAEAVYASGKTAADIANIVMQAADGGHRLLLTRLAPDAFAVLPSPTSALLDYDPISQTAILGRAESRSGLDVAVVSAGMSDVMVAGEALRTLQFAGVATSHVADVGVAGLWRLMERLEQIQKHSVVIAVAGMEGALFSVLAGLIRAPIIAVPTSVGYGVSSGGRLALGSALGSCAPGLVAVNIDNGFGAAQAALRILNLVRREG
ncbi:MAG: nickel pincer cofactor biosynthesis protein LarB [Sulfuritalea sp.]|nr:nickel pincer cofactor biosynthesis protein LarB [Sulfuritalea sp.]